MNKFIKCIKGNKIVSDNLYPEGNKIYRSLVMFFGEERFEILNLEDLEFPPYIGARLDLDGAKNLIKFLEKFINLYEKRCNECYNWSIPYGLIVTGLIRCSHCNAILQEDLKQI